LAKDWQSRMSAESGQPFTTSSMRYETFMLEVRDVINRNSLEQGSNTPDYIIAQYLRDCLMAWDYASQTRAIWQSTSEEST
jgi:hypothetical protein